MHEGHERRGLLTRSSGTHRPCRDTSLCTRCLPANLQLALCRAHKISTKKKKKKKKKRGKWLRTRFGGVGLGGVLTQHLLSGL